MALEKFGVNESLPEGLASDGNNIYLVGQTNKMLYRINPVTAEASKIGSQPNFGAGESKPVGLAFHNNDLYMVGRTGKCLYKVSTVTGKASKVGKQTNFGGMESKPQGLASDGTTLYMTGAQNNALYSVVLEGKDAGKAIKISSFENTDNEPKGLTYHPEKEKLCMVGGEHNQVYTLDPKTGETERLGHPVGFGVEEERPTGITYYKDKLHFVGQQQNKLYSIGEDGIGTLSGSDIIRTGGLRDIGRPIDSPPKSTQAKAQSGGQSRLLIAEQENYWTPQTIGTMQNPPTSSGRTGYTTNINHFYKYIPIVTSIGLSNQTATIPIEFLKGTASANKQQQGGFSYSGGFGIGASVEGTQIFFKGITGATPGVDGSGTAENTDTFTSPSTKQAAKLVNETGIALDNSINGVPIPVTNNPSSPYDTEVIGPQRLTINITTASSRTDNADGFIEVEGYDYHNQKIKERVRIRDGISGASNAIQTKSYFRPYVTGTFGAGSIVSSSSITITAVSGKEPTNARATISSIEETAIVTFKLNDNKDFKGWTIEAQKGGDVCHTYIGVMPVSFTTSLSRDQALTFDFECLAYGMNQYENAEKQDTKKETYEGTSNFVPMTGTSRTPITSIRPYAGMDIRRGTYTDSSNDIQKSGRTEIELPFKQSSQELFTGWQSQLLITDPITDEQDIIPLLDATFTVNQTIEQAMVIMGERNPGPYFRSGLREVTLSGNMLLTQDKDWITIFENNSEFENAELILLNVTTGGFPYKTIFKFGKGQLTTAPDASVDGLGLISVPFNMAFFQNEGGTADDFEIEATYHQDDWFRSEATDGATYNQVNGGLSQT